MEWKKVNAKNPAGGKNPDYEVLLTVATRKHGEESYQQKSFTFNFRNRAFHILLANEAKRIRISAIKPNTNRIYFDLVTNEKDTESIKLGTPNKKLKNYYAARFSFESKTEMEVVCGSWIGEYQLRYDNKEGLYYIEREKK